MKIAISDIQRQTFDANRHVAVRANAGSGKTSVLTLRYIWMVVNDGVPVEQIVAITFTKKAAAEMRNRIHSLVALMLNDGEARLSVGFSSSDELVQSRLVGLRRDLSRVQVTTFHAYCNSILKRYGHYIGMDPQSREIGVAESKHLLKEAIRSTLGQHFRNPFQEVDVLSLYDWLDISGVEAILENFVTDIEHTGDELWWMKPLNAAELATRRKAEIPYLLRPVLLHIVTKIIDGMTPLDLAGNPQADAWFETLKNYRTLLNNALVSPDIVKSIVESFKLLYTKDGAPRKGSKAFEGIEYLPNLELGWKNRLAEVLFDEKSELEQARLLLILRRLSSEAYHLFVAEKRLRRGIDYSDMVSGAIQLLESHPEIRKEVQRSVTHLMVDEFQDTDLRQLHLITLMIPSLTDPTAAIRSTVFIVGDPKQSIYGFRGANVGSFFRAEHLIETSNSARNLPSGLILLPTSYRTAPRLLRAIDRTCEKIFFEVSGLDEAPVPYDNLIEGRQTDFNNEVGSLNVIDLDVMNTFTKEDDDQDGEQASGQYDVVGDFICAVLSGEFPAKVESRSGNGPVLRSPRPADIAVLTRTHDVAKGVAHSLLECGVQFRVHGGREFFSRPEVVDIRNLLVWAADPVDSLALTALLRSPILRVTDNELTTIALSSPEKTISLHSLEKCLSRKNASAGIERASYFLRLFTREIRRRAPGELVRKALEETQWHRTIAGDPRRDQILSNIEKLLSIIDDAHSMVGATLRDVVDAIRVPENDVEGEGAVVTDGDCVQIMTIHQAKGLEFPIVFLVLPDRRKSHSKSHYSSERIGPTFTLPKKQFVATPELTTIKITPALSHISNQIHADVTQLAESSRIMYVALTRAQDHAFVCTNDEQLKSFLLPVAPIQNLSVATSYTSNNADETPIDLSQPVGSAVVESVSVTQLMQVCTADYVPGTGDAESALEFGTAFHDAISTVIGTPDCNNVDTALMRIDIEPDIETFTRVRNMLASVMQSPAYREIPPTSRSEVPYSAILEGTVIQGRLDVVSVADGTAYVWDWKTNAVTNDADVERLVSIYSFQAKAYAWLCFADKSITTVNVTLMFVSAIGAAQNWHARLSYNREDVPSIETELRHALERLAHLTTMNEVADEKTPATILT